MLKKNGDKKENLRDNKGWYIALSVLVIITFLCLITLLILIWICPSNIKLIVEKKGLTISIVGGAGLFIILFRIYFNAYIKLLNIFILLYILISGSLIYTILNSYNNHHKHIEKSLLHFSLARDACLEERNLEELLYMAMPDFIYDPNFILDSKFAFFDSNINDCVVGVIDTGVDFSDFNNSDEYDLPISIVELPDVDPNKYFINKNYILNLKTYSKGWVFFIDRNHNSFVKPAAADTVTLILSKNRALTINEVRTTLQKLLIKCKW